MGEANRKLDAILKQQRNKKVRLYAVFFVAVIILLIGVIAYSTGETIHIKAKVTGLHSQASEELGEHFYIIVNLDSGNVIKLEIPRETSVSGGDTVILNERKTNLFGLTNYSFHKVVR